MKAATIALSIVLAAATSSWLNAQATDAFSNAGEQLYHFSFPRDLYDHPGYETEWWYFTGNLNSLNGSQYGFELTFFRSYIPTGAPPGQPQFSPIIFADLAVSDLDGQRFFFHKALAPETPPLAGITRNPWVIQLGEWTLEEPNDTNGVFHLHALHNDFGVDLDLLPAMPPVLNGYNGLFKLAGSDGQGPEYYEYYSIPRLTVSGSITVKGEAIPVQGLSWNDHEFFTLGAKQTFPSWDWFSIQLDNGASIMLYGLRLPNGDFDPASRGTFVDRYGTVTHLEPGDFVLTPVPGEIWHSVASNADYPIAWTIVIPSLKIELAMSTPLKNQEMAAQLTGGSPAYWEGASRFRGSEDGKPVQGQGYLEMLGYNHQ